MTSFPFLTYLDQVRLSNPTPFPWLLLWHVLDQRTTTAAQNRTQRATTAAFAIMSAFKDNQRDSGEEDRKLEGGVLRQESVPLAPASSGLHPAVYIGYVASPGSTHPMLGLEGQCNGRVANESAPVPGSRVPRESSSSTNGCYQAPSSVCASPTRKTTSLLLTFLLPCLRRHVVENALANALPLNRLP